MPTLTIFKSKFFNNLAIVACGATVAQLISLGISPFLTRLYSAEAFGLMGIFVSVTSVLSAFSSGRYDLAIMLPKEDEAANNLLTLSLFVTVGCSLSLLVLIPLREYIAIYLFSSPDLTPFLLLLPLSMALTGGSKSLDQWNGRHRYFKLISLSAVIGTIGSSVWMLLGGFFGWGALSLILGTVFNQLIKVLVIVGCVRKKLLDSLIQGFDFREIKRLACHYVDFPRYRAPQDSLNALSQNLPSLMLAFFFSSVHVGFFWLSHRVLQVPGALISESFRKVFYQKASEHANAGRAMYPMVLKVTCVLAGVGALPLCVVVFWAPGLFGIVFGGDWTVAGEYAQWLCISTFCGFINAPAIVVAPVLGKQKFMLIFEVFSVLLRSIPMFLVAYFFNSPLYSIAAFSISSALLNLIRIFFILFFCKKHDLNYGN